MSKASNSRPTAISAERARRHILLRSSPVARMSPAKLARILDAFWRGEIREAAELWQRIFLRDDQAITCVGKRTRGTAALDWQVLTMDDSPEAKRHQEALQHFYANVRAVNALDLNERGGLTKLLEQMVTAIGLRYAVHEIVWRPSGSRLTAEFRFLPLQFFENKTGRLRFLPDDSAVDGIELDELLGPGNWMTTCGKGLGEATSVAWLFKTMPLKAAVNYVEKFGIPGLHGETSAAKGSAEWNAMREALLGFGEDLALLTNLGAKITPIAQPSQGNAPHLALVERMDRAISRIWTGGDLTTMSAGGDAAGSNPQSDDLPKLQAEDVGMLNDALQEFVDRQVIAQIFGTEPRAYFKLQTPSRVDTTREIAIDQFLIAHGVKRGVRELAERYNRPEIATDDVPASAPTQAAAQPAPLFGGINERTPEAVARELSKNTASAAQRALIEKLQPVFAELRHAINQESDAGFVAALGKARDALRAHARQLSLTPDDPLVKSIHDGLGAALINGAAAGRFKQATATA